MAAAKAESSSRFKTNWAFRLVSSALAKNSRNSRSSTVVHSWRRCCELKVKAVGKISKETFVPEDGLAPVAVTGLRGFFAKFTVLKGAQRELWLTFAIKLLIILAYSITNKTL